MPLIATGRPFSKRIVTVSGLSGACVAKTPMPGVTKFGGVWSDSSLPASWVRPSRFASVEYGASFVTLIGNFSQRVELPLQSVVTRQIRLQGSCASAGEYPAAIELVASGAIDVDNLISARVPLEDAAGWFDRLYRREPNLMKVVVQPSAV